MSSKRMTRPANRKRTAATAIRSKTSRTKRQPRTSAGAARKSKPRRRRAAPRSHRHLDFIDAAARVLDLAIEPAWKPAVAANLEATLRLAASFMEFPLPDEAEPAPIFVA